MSGMESCATGKDNYSHFFNDDDDDSVDDGDDDVNVDNGGRCRLG